MYKNLNQTCYGGFGKCPQEFRQDIGECLSRSPFLIQKETEGPVLGASDFSLAWRSRGFSSPCIARVAHFSPLFIEVEWQKP